MTSCEAARHMYMHTHTHTHAHSTIQTCLPCTGSEYFVIAAVSTPTIMPISTLADITTRNWAIPRPICQQQEQTGSMHNLLWNIIYVTLHENILYTLHMYIYPIAMVNVGSLSSVGYLLHIQLASNTSCQGNTGRHDRRGGRLVSFLHSYWRKLRTQTIQTTYLIRTYVSGWGTVRLWMWMNMCTLLHPSQW